MLFKIFPCICRRCKWLYFILHINMTFGLYFFLICFINAINREHNDRAAYPKLYFLFNLIFYYRCVCVIIK